MLSVGLTMVVHSVQLYMNVNKYKKLLFSCIATQNTIIRSNLSTIPARNPIWVFQNILNKEIKTCRNTEGFLFFANGVIAPPPFKDYSYKYTWP